MAFRVEIAPQAFDDLDQIADYIRTRGSLESAERWFNEIIDDIRSLQQMPGRCARAEESVEIDADVRVLLHGKRNRRYTIYFAIHRETQTGQCFPRSSLGQKAVECRRNAELGVRDLKNVATGHSPPTTARRSEMKARAWRRNARPLYLCHTNSP